MVNRPLVEQFNLRSKLRFSLERGDIWLEENRMMMLHARSLGVLRHELFSLLGERKARGLLVRMGFSAGQQDAELACKMRSKGDPLDVFKIGPELYSFEGFGNAHILSAAVDWELGHFSGEVEREHSWEAEAHIQRYGTSESVVCWSFVGHASGYCSQFFKRFIVFREEECIAKGDAKCRIVGKPAEEWGDEYDYQNYFDKDDVAGALRETEAQLNALRGGHPKTLSPEKIVGQTLSFRTAFDQLRTAAESPINVMLVGETGVGKEMFAQWLHQHSKRADKPFVSFNCAAVPHDLIETELFGVQRSASTGMEVSRAGRLERADGGTIFLDDVEELSLAAQVKLLRVLQTGEVERLGDDRARKVSVRVVAASNDDLKQAVNDGRFRASLYYRLATFVVTVPPLRQRRGDIPLLVSALIEKFEGPYQKRIQGVSDRAMNVLMSHPFDGNVQELENLIERGILLAASGGWIELEHLFSDSSVQLKMGAELDLRGHLMSIEKSIQSDFYRNFLDVDFDLKKHEATLLEVAVHKANGNLTQAARSLGITRRQLAYRLKLVQDSSDD